MWWAHPRSISGPLPHSILQVLLPLIVTTLIATIDSHAPTSSELQSAAPTSSDKTFIFVGDKQCGKTSLIARLLDEPLKDDVKETTALDFRFGTRTKEEKK